MTLLEIRTEFLKYSGRTDLVNPNTFADNGANKLIYFGQQFLEGKLDLRRARLRYQKDIVANAYRLIVPSIAVVDKINVTDSEKTTKVDLKSLDWFYDNYGKTLSDVSSGRPVYYTISPAFLHESQKDLKAGSTTLYTTQASYDSESLILADQGSRFTDDLLLLMPPADATYTVSVHGKFDSVEMTDDVDENIWSAGYAQLLLFAALWALEARMRNSEGMKDREAMIDRLLFGIDKDQADFDSADRKAFRVI